MIASEQERSHAEMRDHTRDFDIDCIAAEKLFLENLLPGL